MKNILFISPNPVWGGAATANLTIAKMLQDNAYNVIVNDEYYAGERHGTLKIDHTPVHQRRFTDRTLLKALVEKNDIDCIVWSPLAAIYFYKDIIDLKKAGIKQIAIVHSLSLTNNFKGRLMDVLISLTISKMSAIVYVSNYTLNSWNKFRAVRKSKASKVVIHNPVDILCEKHSLHSEKPRIGFVGRLSDEKQPEIFCELSEKTKDFDFYVYGDGPLMPELKSRYKNVEFKGLCTDLQEIYHNIDILVMTSKFENCPMVILEARNFGIPCVVPNVGGIPEVVDTGFNGFLYDEYNSDTILKAINQTMSNYEEFSANCLKSSVNHSPSNLINRWKEVLE